MNRVSIDHKGQSRRFSLPGHKYEKEAGTWIFGQNHLFRNFDVAVPTSGSQGASRRPLTAGGRHFRSLSEGLLNIALKSTWVLYYRHPTFHVLRISEMGNILLK